MARVRQSVSFEPVTSDGEENQKVEVRKKLFALANSSSASVAGQHEIHDHVERALAGFADGVRERAEANTGSVSAMESARQLQDRDVRNSSGRLGRIYALGLRRCAGGAQIFHDVARVY